MSACATGEIHLAGAARPLQIDEGTLAGEAPTVSAQCAVAADDAMAGDDQRHSVGGASARYGTSGGGLANAGGNLAVGLHVTAGNGLQVVPDAHLKSGGADVEGKRRTWLDACEMTVEGLDPSAEAGGVRLARGVLGVGVGRG